MTVSYLDSQPLEFKDFSGGFTDNILQGDSHRFAVGDNFLSTTDKKLLERDGTKVFDPTGYSLELGQRVSGLFTAINETVLFGHSGRDFYTQQPASLYGTAFTKVLGPTGNEALSGGVNYSQVTTGEFQRQVYYTSDYGVLPGKLFRDQTGAWKAVTAGLPKLALTPNYPTDASLLPTCISLANDLRASMIDHFTDVDVPGTGQHNIEDKWSLGYLEAVTWVIADPEYPGPSPIPTPAPDATDEASLYTLCEALAIAYEHHRNDLSGPTPTLGLGSKLYHHLLVLFPTGTADPFGGGSGTVPSNIGSSAKLVKPGVNTNVYKAAAFLDDLATKWYWHQLSPFSHAPDNDYTLMSRYLLAADNDSIRIGTIYITPNKLQVEVNYDDFIALALWAKSALNKHALGTGVGTNNYHGQVDPYTQITLPDPVDYDSAALTIFWARWLYGSLHVYDSNVAVHSRISFTMTSGSANITSVVLTSSGAAYTLPVDAWVLTAADTFNDADPNNRRAARVMASGSGTATLSRTASASGAGQTAQESMSWFHGAYLGGLTNAACDTTTSLATPDEFIDSVGTIGTDLGTWLTLGSELFLSLGAHEANGYAGTTVASHKQANFLSNDLQGASSVNGNPFFLPTIASYAWASFYAYTYTVEMNGLTYINRGAPIFSDSTQVMPSYPVGTIIPSANDNYFSDATIVVENPCATLSGVPQLANTTLTNYDTTVSVAPPPENSSVTGFYKNFTIELYRTTNGGTTFYYLESIVNTTIDYTDAVNENYPRLGETALNTRKVLYTSGGVAANDQPPVCKYLHHFNGYTYFGAITDTGQYFPQRIRQSKQNEPDSAPATFFDDIGDDLVGLTSTQNNLLAIAQNSVFRMSGAFTSTGQGALTHDRILSAVGGLNARSIIATDVGIFYAGTNGFYYTDGFQAFKISLEFDKTYAKYTTSSEQKARIYGGYDENTRTVWWAMQSNPTAKDNDVIFVYSLNFGVKPSGFFTRVFTTHSWMPSSLCFYSGRLIIGDTRGYIFKTDPDTKTDPLINTSAAPANWRTAYIPWLYRSCALDFGTADKRKYTTRIHCVGENVGDVSLQLATIGDMGRAPNYTESKKLLAPVQYRHNLVWGDATIIWGDETLVWNPKGNMDLFRRMPSRSLRSDFRQVEYAPGNFVVYKYDTYPEFSFAEVDATAKTAEILTPTGYTDIVWPKDSVDYYISFDTDNYEQSYLITAISGDLTTLTYADPNNLSVNAAEAKWQISGIMKEQRIKITCFTIKTAMLGEEVEAYPGNSESGGQGANE
jgi:hypothetical protein